MRTWVSGTLGSGLAVAVAIGSIFFAHRTTPVFASSTPSPSAPRIPAYEHAGHMGTHMLMTELRPVRPGDKERAAAVQAAALKFAANYSDYHKAIADGYEIQFPNSRMAMTHFVRKGFTQDFQPSYPQLLIYSQQDGPGPKYKLVGVSYLAPYDATDAELDGRVPLSIGQWHTHNNVCMPPNADKVDWIENNPRFGIDGSILTKAECDAAHGQFIVHWGGWMLHVFPFEQGNDKVWQPDMHAAMGKDVGMKMGPGDKM